MDEMDTVTSCYLCSKSIVLKGGDKTSFTEHISTVHGVTVNLSFLAAWNFLDLNVRNNMESLVMSITVNSRGTDHYQGSSGENRLVIDEDELGDDELDEDFHYETDDCESRQDGNLKRKREANIKQSRNNSNKRIMKENNVIKEVDDEEDVGIKIEECDVEVKMEYEESPVRNPIKIKTPMKLNEESLKRNPIKIKTPVKLNEESSIRNPITIKTPAKLNEESLIRNPIKNKTPAKLGKVTASDIQVSVSPEKCLPPGWKTNVKTFRKRGNKTQTRMNQYISPEGAVFTNFKDVEKNMMETGIYSREDIVKAKQYMIYLSLK
jgi:hypothetical protein